MSTLFSFPLHIRISLDVFFNKIEVETLSDCKRMYWAGNGKGIGDKSYKISNNYALFCVPSLATFPADHHKNQNLIYWVAFPFCAFCPPKKQSHFWYLQTRMRIIYGVARTIGCSIRFNKGWAILVNQYKFWREIQILTFEKGQVWCVQI